MKKKKLCTVFIVRDFFLLFVVILHGFFPSITPGIENTWQDLKLLWYEYDQDKYIFDAYGNLFTRIHIFFLFMMFDSVPFFSSYEMEGDDTKYISDFQFNIFLHATNSPLFFPYLAKYFSIPFEISFDNLSNVKHVNEKKRNENIPKKRVNGSDSRIFTTHSNAMNYCVSAFSFSMLIGQQIFTEFSIKKM